MVTIPNCIYSYFIQIFIKQTFIHITYFEYLFLVFVFVYLDNDFFVFFPTASASAFLARQKIQAKLVLQVYDVKNILKNKKYLIQCSKISELEKSKLFFMLDYFFFITMYNIYTYVFIIPSNKTIFSKNH